ncbi:MAG: FAD-dependent oxidoreductase [Pseudomonadota bacterium]
MCGASVAVTSVAIIGAGITGTIAALSLADAGVRVVLFEADDAPLLGASLANEGKVHLGYVYAMDTSLETSRRMLEGATVFRDILCRWIARDAIEPHQSRPFLYAIPNSSMMSADAIRVHFSRVSQMANEVGGGLFRCANTVPQEIAPAKMAQLFDPSRVRAAFQTDELAIDTHAVRRGLVSALAAHPRIETRTSTRVCSVERGTSAFEVLSQAQGVQTTETFDHVVNAAWQHRLEIDAGFGLVADRPVIHRYKFGLRTADPTVCKSLPPVTFLVGEYGDTVSYGENAYVSWYPGGMVSQETALSPAFDPDRLSPVTRQDIAKTMRHELAALMPGATNALNDPRTQWELIGGFITAWGKTGINDAHSELHARHEVGVHSYDGYHSIDTGKYTLGPACGVEVAARILG